MKLLECGWCQFYTNTIQIQRHFKTFVGLKEESTALIAISVFPNPTNQDFTVIIPKQNETVHCVVTDLQNKVVLTQSFEKNNDVFNEHHIQTEWLSKGIYFLTLTTSTHKQNLKIIVQ